MSPEAATTVTCWLAAAWSAAFTLLAWARLTQCSPPICPAALVDMTPPSVLPSRREPTAAAPAFLVLAKLQPAAGLGGGAAGCRAGPPLLAALVWAGLQAVASRAASGMATASSRSRRPRGTATGVLENLLIISIFAIPPSQFAVQGRRRVIEWRRRGEAVQSWGRSCDVDDPSVFQELLPL